MTPAGSTESDAPEGQLQAGLKPRHMTMIALGGIFGAGLFVGSSAVIGTVGPGAVMSYLFAGILVILVARTGGDCPVGRRIGTRDQPTRSIRFDRA